MTTKLAKPKIDIGTNMKETKTKSSNKEYGG